MTLKPILTDLFKKSQNCTIGRSSADDRPITFESGDDRPMIGRQSADTSADEKGPTIGRSSADCQNPKAVGRWKKI